ncbi:hypothetical protein B7R54_01380 [Subtercola boreus]|uniref:DUF4440 domain-containing protein n=1 Tax=Subtercola boreus TaxID=120213 RepID=A0A3E0VEY6_9MICO|nr:DUF4440 domain-containing protein [Subtercola boreus]RFA08018.1 hypothetical protein B7R54_01380 [Subtercola boreus]TQL55113.1 hypothetical protein FB464_2670 [Subtercola boreus]
MDERGELPAHESPARPRGSAAAGDVDELTRAEYVEQAVIDCERRLLDPAVRLDPVAVDQLLDPEFREIGQSGRLWSRPEMVAALATLDMSSTLDAHEFSDPRVESLAPELHLLTYLLRSGSGLTRRSSIWRESETGFRCVFHQGTRLA